MGLIRVTVNLPAIRKDNIITKFVNFIKIKLFMKKARYKENNISLNKDLSRSDYLLNIQRRFEAGEIKEEEISKEDTVELKKLYEEQIRLLNGEIKLIEDEILKGY